AARAERSGDPVVRAWRRLGRRYARLGLARAPHEPALQWVERVAAARPGDAGALRALGRRFAQWRYAPAAAEAPRRLARALRPHGPPQISSPAPPPACGGGWEGGARHRRQ